MNDYTKLVFQSTSGGRFSVLTGEPALILVECRYPKKPARRPTRGPRVPT